MWAAAIAVGLAGAARAEPPTPADCTKAALRKARAAAAAAARAHDAKGAIAILEPVLRGCGDARDATERGWLASDLAAVYADDGQPLRCVQLMAPLSHPKSDVHDAGSDKLVKAIDYNLDRCAKALDGQYAAIKSGGCAFKVDGAIAAAAVPPALVPKGATAACVALVRGRRPAMADADDVVCPKVALVWSGGKTDLAADASPLTDDSVCCNLSSIAVGTMAGKTLVRVRGNGRDCAGGTADTATDVFYDWTGPALTTAVDASVALH